MLNKKKTKEQDEVVFRYLVVDWLRFSWDWTSDRRDQRKSKIKQIC